MVYINWYGIGIHRWSGILVSRLVLVVLFIIKMFTAVPIELFLSPCIICGVQQSPKLSLNLIVSSCYIVEFWSAKKKIK